MRPLPVVAGLVLTVVVHGALLASAVLWRSTSTADWAIDEVLLSEENPALEAVTQVFKEIDREAREQLFDPRRACKRALASGEGHVGGWALSQILVPAWLAEGSAESLSRVDQLCAELERQSQGEDVGTVRFGLCGTRRCSLPEVARKRRDPEPPPLDDLVLEAELLPALGAVEADPRKLPELQTYEQKEIVEDGVNLEKDNEPPKEDLKKQYDPKEAKRDKKVDNKLEDLLKDYEDDDPRRRPTDLTRIVGDEDGEVGGTADVKKAGNRYGAQVRRALRRDFRVPPFIDHDTLKTLSFVIVVSKLGMDGSIVSYRVAKRSGNGTFDDAAMATIKRYAVQDGGSKTLPVPEPDVLHFINAKGMRIVLDGRYMVR